VPVISARVLFCGVGPQALRVQTRRKKGGLSRDYLKKMTDNRVTTSRLIETCIID
jgi:hypothetical protein